MGKPFVIRVGNPPGPVRGACRHAAYGNFLARRQLEAQFVRHELRAVLELGHIGTHKKLGVGFGLARLEVFRVINIEAGQLPAGLVIFLPVLIYPVGALGVRLEPGVRGV